MVRSLMSSTSSLWADWALAQRTACPAVRSRPLPGRSLLLWVRRSHRWRSAWNISLWLVLLMAGYETRATATGTGSLCIACGLAGAEDQRNASHNRPRPVQSSGHAGAEDQHHLNLTRDVRKTTGQHGSALQRKLSVETSFGIASRTAASSSALSTIEYVNYSGSLTFHGGRSSNKSNDPWKTGKALVNLLSYDRDLDYPAYPTWRTLEQTYKFDREDSLFFQELMDGQCQRWQRWSTTLTDGLTTKYFSRDRIATVGGSYLPFIGETGDKTIKVKQSGVVAICYCSMLTGANLCSDRTNWFYADRVTVKGPQGGQSWILPTNIAVNIDVKGWGFSSNDKLRLIPKTGSCESSNGNPAGEISFKIGCPSTQPPGGCRYATSSDSIGLNVQTASGSGVYIDGITIGELTSVLSFTGSVQHVLEVDDIITIDVDSMEVYGSLFASMNPGEKAAALKLSGEQPFADDSSQRYMHGIRVNEVMLSRSNAVDYSKMAVNVGWPDEGRPAFTFVEQKGLWTRRNKEETASEIKGMTARKDLKACWGVTETINGGPVTKYYAQAGEVEFRDPPAMKDARVNLCTKMDQAVAPIIIAFTTGAERDEYSKTKAATTQLMLRFLDVGDDGKLLLRKTGDTPPVGGTGPAVFAADEEVLESNKRQVICGQLFSELWSDDPQGFPMPSGCYYSKRYKDDEEEGRATNLKFYRELYLTFPPGSGLKRNTKYQLVMNAKTASVVYADNLVDLYTMCVIVPGSAGCERPHQVFERGRSEASMATESQAGYADPSFVSGGGGFMLPLGDPTNSVFNLSNENVIQIKLRGEAGIRAITPSCLLRVYLWPLTMWTLDPGMCSAKCIGHSDRTGETCTGAVGCSAEEVVLGSERRNIIKLQLPQLMDPMAEDIMHTLNVTGLKLPAGGYFPSRVGAQLTRPDDTKPDYTTSVGFLMKDSEAGSTTGRLVVAGRSGYGTKPFPSDTDNILYLRISFGITVRNTGKTSESGSAASVSVTLPAGYTCKVPDGGLVDFTSLDVFTLDNDKDGFYDYTRGYLSVASEDGNWDASAGRTCTYQVSSYNTIFAGTVAYVKIAVDNPGQEIRKIDPNNVWQIQVQQKGILADATYPVYKQPNLTFISLAEEKQLGVNLWGGNAAVLSPLQYETLQPTQFRISNATHVQTGDVHVFFKTTKFLGQRGYVILDAPLGFDFGASCAAQSLDSQYYVFRGISKDRLKPLRDIRSCIGLRYPSTAPTYNRARIMVGGVLDAGKNYGFKIGIANPTDYTTTQHTDWYIWTQDSDMYGIQGTNGVIRFNRNQGILQTSYFHKGFGVYEGEFFRNFHVELMDRTPKSISGADANVMVFPLYFKADTTTSLRITAPLGYIWNVGQFKVTANMSTADFPDSPALENGNQLLWKKIRFRGGQSYGFQANIAVPDVSPAVSSNAFYVEFGFNYDSLSDRLMAAAIPVLPVKSITDTVVSYASNLLGYSSNYLEFRFITQTPLNENAGVLIKGDANTAGFVMSCPPVLLPGSLSLPIDIKCSTQAGSDGLPQLMLKVASISMASGYYAFELAATNPSSTVTTPGKWEFGTYNNVAERGRTPIDKGLVAPGFAINGPLLDAGLVPITAEQRLLTLRNDRPNQANQLIFRFELRNSPPSTDNTLLRLRGPRGFVFSEDCLSSVVTSSNEVFGPNTEFAADFSPLPPQAAPTACNGDGRFATLTIPAGLTNGTMYAFRIGVLSNPVKTQVWNRWTIDCASESSLPFEGFAIWTFTQTLVRPVSLATSPTGANVARTKNPVTINFRPYNRIPSKCSTCTSGGLIRLNTPANFELVQVNGACYEPLLMETGGAVRFTAADISCKVGSSTKLLVELTGTKHVTSGRDYTLIVHVHNPPTTVSAGNWSLASFSDNTALEGAALDDVTISGHDINNVSNAWTVSNTYNITNGKTLVMDLDFNMQFPDALKDGDNIEVVGPRGFNLQGNAQALECRAFRWRQTPIPLPNSANPLCVCEAGFCTVRFTVRESQNPAYPANFNLKFAVGTENPARTPFITDNFWKVYHLRRGVVMTSDIYRSWSITSQLEDVQIQLVGVNRAAGRTSVISVAFTPVTDADTIKIQALLPLEFDFSGATVGRPFTIGNSSAKEAIVLNNCAIIAGRRTTIRLAFVKLGAGGGQTKFSIFTYSDRTREVKMDEKIEYTGGFRLPGSITVVSKELTSVYKDNRQLYPVKSLFQPRASEEAKVLFTLTFSQQVHAGERLRVKCEGDGAYELKIAPFTIVEKGVESATQCDASEGGRRVDASVVSVQGTSAEIVATLMPSISAGQQASTVALRANTPYSIVMSGVPNVGTNTWLFETLDGGQYQTNTNDGMTSGFQPVEQMTLQVQAAKSPPKGTIEVILNVNKGSAVVKKLMVIAPPHFIFPSSCGEMCKSGQALGFTHRRTATIESPSGGHLTKFTGLKILVETPEKTPDSMTWFVEGRGLTGMTTGWGNTTGDSEFPIVQMPISRVVYAGVAGLDSGEITFRFRLTRNAGPYAEIMVEQPAGYLIKCAGADALKQISLPGSTPVCKENPLVLTVSSELDAGEYAFGLAVDVPLQKPNPNTWNIVVRDRDKNVIDSAYLLPGAEIVDLPMISPTLEWSSTEPGKVSTIKLGLTFIGATTAIKAFVIKFPHGLIHYVQKLTDVKNLNNRFPVALTYPGGWADTSEKDQIKIFMDQSEATTLIGRDRYSISFPVLVPSGAAPWENVWFLSVCAQASCGAPPYGAGSLVTFPIVGFTF